ncbi:recombinase family protein [Wolbachia endosymbiont of Cantharis cryptica]|uniref:recombinase family protein n=1 Tax=Wolbachia endosymbiont of Cantharis cryptica TaxID=3066132 RepID=UPI00376EF171
MLKQVRCAVYTRKSCEDKVEQEFNSLDAQRMSGEHYIKSRQQEGWVIVDKRYDDEGFSGGNLKRPGLQKLFEDIKAGAIDCVVIYKIDRLSRSLLDFAEIVDLFDKNKVTFVSVTQSFNTADPIGRLMLNIILSFAQYERELAAERVRDKIAASRKKGLWTGGLPPLGFDVKDKKLAVNKKEAELVKNIFESFIDSRSVTEMIRKLNKEGHCTKKRQRKSGQISGGEPFKKKTLYGILTNPIYNGRIKYKENLYPGQHEAIIDDEQWQKVQDTIKNPEGRKSPTETNHLLKGMINCSCGASMIPAYTKKQGRKYCYYVCRNHQQGIECKSSQRNIAAGEIEQIVMRCMPKILSNSLNCDKEEPLNPKEQNLSVHEDGIEFCMNKNEEPIFIPVKFKKRGGRTMITNPEEKEADDTLLKALVRAELWQNQLNSGKFATIGELCKHEKLREKYVQYILRLNYLAPKIKEDILNGTQPDHLKLIDFKKTKIPLLWSEQLEKFYGSTEKAA